MSHSVTPWTAACQASPSPRVCPRSCPLHCRYHPAISSSDSLFCPQSFPASGTFPLNWLFESGDWSFSFSISPSNEYSRKISFKMDWFDLLVVQGTFRVFSSTTFQRHQFFGAQSLLWSNSHIHTRLLEKPLLWLYGPLTDLKDGAGPSCYNDFRTHSNCCWKHKASLIPYTHRGISLTCILKWLFCNQLNNEQ